MFIFTASTYLNSCSHIPDIHGLYSSVALSCGGGLCKSVYEWAHFEIYVTIHPRYVKYGIIFMCYLNCVSYCKKYISFLCTKCYIIKIKRQFSLQVLGVDLETFFWHFKSHPPPEKSGHFSLTYRSQHRSDMQCHPSGRNLLFFDTSLLQQQAWSAAWSAWCNSDSLNTCAQPINNMLTCSSSLTSKDIHSPDLVEDKLAMSLSHM